MERKLQSPVPPLDQRHRNKNNTHQASLPENYHTEPPDSFDCLISYETDIRTWKSVNKELGPVSVDPLADLRGGTTEQRTKSKFPTAQNLARGKFSEEGTSVKPREVPVRDGDHILKRPTSFSQKKLVSPTGDQDYLNLLFSPDSLPVSPSLSPVDSSDFRTSCSDSEQIISGDRSTARYLRILKPHKDSASDVEEVCSPPRLGASLNISESDPFDANPSFAENLLLESPSSSPSHFSRLRLTLSTGESETDASVVEPSSEIISPRSSLHTETYHLPQVTSVSKIPKLHEVPKRKKSAKKRIFHDPHSKTESVRQVPDTALIQTTSNKEAVVLDKAVIRNLESEIKKLVVDIYSEKAHQFVPIPGLRTTRMDHHDDGDVLNHVSGKDGLNSTGNTSMCP